jgi:hypothetical protein
MEMPAFEMAIGDDGFSFGESGCDGTELKGLGPSKTGACQGKEQARSCTVASLRVSLANWKWETGGVQTDYLMQTHSRLNCPVSASPCLESESCSVHFLWCPA